MDGRWTKANDAICREYNKSPISFAKLNLDKLDLNIGSQSLQDAFLASGQPGSIPYGFVVPFTVTKNGKTYREKAIWVNDRKDLNGGVFVHELLHLYSWPLPKMTRHDLSEGLTEYFTRKINWVYSNSAYNHQVTEVEDFIKKHGCEDGLKKWYFCNRPQDITQSLGEIFVKWRYGKS
ncbi:MAG: hypothetical protein ABI822_19915 [Bryobacteraceae bacterium]